PPRRSIAGITCMIFTETPENLPTSQLYPWRGCAARTDQRRPGGGVTDSPPTGSDSPLFRLPHPRPGDRRGCNEACGTVSSKAWAVQHLWTNGNRGRRCLTCVRCVTGEYLLRIDEIGGVA